MPLYRFAFDKHDVPSDQEAEWLPDDLAALRFAAQVTADLARNRQDSDQAPVVLAVRVLSRL
jgi:hypothetical protein